MSQITIGIEEVGFAPVGSTTYEPLGYTTLDSFQMETPEGTTTEFFVEESDSPVFATTTSGSKTITFEVANPDLESFQEVFGGTITGTAPNRKLEFPATAPILEKAMRVKTKFGYNLIWPRVTLKATLGANLGKNAMLTYTVTATVLAPASGSDFILEEVA